MREGPAFLFDLDGTLVDSVYQHGTAQGAGKYLSKAGIPWAIASSGKMESAGLGLKVPGVNPRKAIVVTRDQVRYAKPDPDLFLTAVERLGAKIGASNVVGDSVWDLLAARRASALGVALL